jgi:hypothetical protein
MPVSEILHAAGVDFAGSLPLEIQFVQVFTAAVVAGSEEIEGSKRLIEFLASARASETIRKSGMEPRDLQLVGFPLMDDAEFNCRAPAVGVGTYAAQYMCGSISGSVYKRLST